MPADGRWDLTWRLED